MYWVLKVEKQMKAVDYNDRLKVSRELSATIGQQGLRHNSGKTAAVAAEAISRSPLVLRVTVTRMQEVSEGVWRGGRKTKD